MVRRKQAPKEAPPTGPTAQVAVRMPIDLLAQVEAFGARKAKEAGLPVNRAQAILYLVRAGLEREARL